jgi:hypothetical protein
MQTDLLHGAGRRRSPGSGPDQSRSASKFDLGSRARADGPADQTDRVLVMTAEALLHERAVPLPVMV